MMEDLERPKGLIINLKEYDYLLPPERIAQYPLPQRDHARLLYYHKGQTSHHYFYDLANLLPTKTLLVFNDTKVIPARIVCQKPEGGWIEVFLLNPVAPFSDVQAAMAASLTVTWKCLIGNKKRFKRPLEVPLIIHGQSLQVNIHLIEPKNDFVEFSWNNNSFSFSDILMALGQLPLPPYISRELQKEDEQRYQTVYSKQEGAVAAPTAGLHFTQKVLDDLNKKNIATDFLTLHVSAGTFQPVKVENAVEHPMHAEQVIVSKKNIETLLGHQNELIIPVGTTSMRTLESLYWYGVKLLQTSTNDFLIDKLFAYQFQESALPTFTRSLETIGEFMDKHHLSKIQGSTEIYIFPGYKFRVCKGIITNYHMPQTTLILLVAALLGEDWRKVYQQALDNNYRFLSYGDSSLLVP